TQHCCWRTNEYGSGLCASGPTSTGYWSRQNCAKKSTIESTERVGDYDLLQRPAPHRPPADPASKVVMTALAACPSRWPRFAPPVRSAELREWQHAIGPLS